MYFSNFTSLFLILFLLVSNSLNVYAVTEKEDNQSNPPNSRLEGQITANDEPVPHATVQVKSTTIGTAANQEGEFDIEVPSGEQTIVIRALGYKPKEKQLKIEGGEKNKMSFDIEEDVLGLEQVVVTAARDDEKRKESSVIVNTLNNPMLEAIQAANLSEGLAFSPGLRIENNCGTCGANSLRMNGMDGPYTQILINGRPIFSGLAAVYGLELIPANMIERVEVVRGGGSALYGSNAIAGTVNVLTREPNKNQYSVNAQTSHIGSFYDQADPGTGRQVNFNTTLSDEENKNGVALYGSIRERNPFDANDDGFSELSEISNTTVGGQWSLRTGNKSKLVTDFFHIREDRRGGDQFDAPLHESLIAEATEHQINSGNISWVYFPGPDQELTTYAAAQDIQRDSYYGAGQALDAYGNTEDLSYSGGVQYKIITGRGDIIAGVEVNGGNLLDKKKGYREFSVDENTTEIIEEEVPARTIADQETMVSGGFAQI
ncbi:MAG: TonB-dependent receptor, partial [Marinilabilia sp.]